MKISPASAQYNIDPNPALDFYRVHNPVYWNSEFNAWMLFRHDDVKFALTDARLTNNREIADHFTGYNEAHPTLTSLYRNSVFNDNSSEAHIANRKIAVKVFSRSAIEQIKTKVHDIIERLLSPILSQSSIDFARDISPAIPFEVICGMLGVPDYGSRKAEFLRNAGLLADSFNPLRKGDALDACDIGASKVIEEIAHLVAERRAHPQDDIITDFIAEIDNSSHFSEINVANIFASLISTGSSGTVHAINMMIKTAYEHSHIIDQLQQQPSLIPVAVDEILRYASAVKFLYRFACEDFIYKGQAFNKGQTLMLSVASANRDETVFTQADQLDLHRDPKELAAVLSFGQGKHFCLGIHLARMQLIAVLRFFVSHVPVAAVNNDSIRFNDNDMLSRSIANMLLVMPQEPG